jgi:rhodanese-related sulfurtransferase/uncharacterized membrane protein YedE/YeeE
MTIPTLPAALTAVPIGIAFGFLLERAGLGDPRRILGQLVLRDFAVLRVMFGAIITALLLLQWSSAMGWLDLTTLATPPTDLGAQALGAVIFGGGFALAALCPGTACVAAASGRRDGVAAVSGVFLGTLVTPLLWPTLGPAAARLPREAALLPHDFGLPTGVVVLALTTLGVVTFALARRAEGGPSTSPWWRPTALEQGALVLAAALALVSARPSATPGQLTAIAQDIEGEQDHVDPLDLATWIRQRRPGLRVIDVREGLDSTTYLIPGAETIRLAEIGAVTIEPGQLVVLYSDGGTHAAQAWVLLRVRGFTNVRVLKDGMAAWEDEVLSPRAPVHPDEAAQRRFERARELSLWFGGHPVRAGATSTPPASPTPRPRRRNTC